MDLLLLGVAFLFVALVFLVATLAIVSGWWNPRGIQDREFSAKNKEIWVSSESHGNGQLEEIKETLGRVFFRLRGQSEFFPVRLFDSPLGPMNCWVVDVVGGILGDARFLYHCDNMQLKYASRSNLMRLLHKANISNKALTRENIMLRTADLEGMQHYASVYKTAKDKMGEIAIKQKDGGK